MEVAVYGAGVHGEAFFNALKQKNIEVDYFIDQYTTKTHYMDLPVYKAENIHNKKVEIYISVSLEDSTVIPNFLHTKGFNKINDFVESLKKIDTILPNLMETNVLWMRENNREFIDEEKIKDVLSLLADDESKNLFTKIVDFRKTLDMNKYVFPESSKFQYFPDDIELFEKIAFIGDIVTKTVTYMKRRNIDVECIISFEPDLKNIQSLQKEIRVQKQLFPTTHFIVFPAGLWSENKILKFFNNGNSASSICETDSATTDSIEIFSVDLDTTLAGLEPNFIKMDIEGAEQEAIKGAINIIKKHTPVLAICLYHKPKDLWEIPLLINNINPNYDMYIRVYGHLQVETVLYCVPKD